MPIASTFFNIFLLLSALQHRSFSFFSFNINQIWRTHSNLFPSLLAPILTHFHAWLHSYHISLFLLCSQTVLGRNNGVLHTTNIPSLKRQTYLCSTWGHSDLCHFRHQYYNINKPWPPRTTPHPASKSELIIDLFIFFLSRTDYNTRHFFSKRSLHYQWF